MKRPTAHGWRPWRSDPHPVVLFGGYGLVVVTVFALAGLGSAVAMAAVGLLLAAMIATLGWWSGQPFPEAQSRAASNTAPAPTETPAPAGRHTPGPG